MEMILVEERVFHVDRECYIVYLGSDREDERPFLRIGNSKFLNQEIIKNISSIVITDSLTGDPTLEPMNVTPEAIRNSRYVGDKKTINNYFGFIHHINIEDGLAGSLEGIRDTHDKAEVIFYDNGNIHLLYDRKVLFDLRAREKKDLHFIQEANWLKDTLRKNPLRYFPGDLQNQGFLIIGGTFLLFERQKILSFELPENYFTSLVLSGIDPDLIDTVITDKVSSSFITYLKRKISRRESVKIFTEDPSLVKSAMNLFKAGQITQLKGDCENFAEGQQKKISGYRIEKTADGYRITHKLLPRPLLLSNQLMSGSGDTLVINPARGILLPPDKTAGLPVLLAEGIPYLFCIEFPPEKRMLELYFKELMPLFHDSLSPEASILAKQLERFFDDAAAGAWGKAAADRIKKQIKKVKVNSKSGFVYLLINAGGICTHLLHKESTDSSIKSILSTIIGYINRRTPSISKMDTHFPLICDTYLTPGGCVPFYRTVKSPIYKEDYALLQEREKEILKKDREERLSYDQEKERLAQFMNELFAYPSEKARKLPLKEEEKRGAVSGPVLAKDEEPIKPTEGVLIPGQKKPERHARHAGHAGKKLKILIPIAAAIAVGIIVAVITLFPGKPTVKSEEKAVQERSAQTRAEQPSPEGKTIEREGVKVEMPAGEESTADQLSLTAQIGEAFPLYKGLIRITILDVYLLTNKIAVKNGYRKLDSISQMGKDPDWIYPGNLFTLPDETEYTVVKGDTQWYIAQRFIVKRLDEDWDMYIKIVKEIDNSYARVDNRERLLQELEYLKKRSYSENFVKEIEKNIEKLVEEG